MAQVAVNRVDNGNVYIDGNNLLGKIEEIQLPDVEVMLEKHMALGMVGEIELPSGLQTMKGSLKINSVYADVALLLGDFFNSHQLQVRSSVKSYGPGGKTAEVPLVTFLTVQFTKIPGGTIKPRANAEFSSSYTATYFKQTLNGVDLFEVDYYTNLLKVGGINSLLLFNNNQGA